MSSCAKRSASKSVGHCAPLLALLASVLIGALAACSPESAPPTATPSLPSAESTRDPHLGCIAVEAPPTESAAAVLPPITPADFVRGPADAAATMLVYCDLQSPQCQVFAHVLNELVVTYGSDLRVVQRLRPVPVSEIPELDKSELSARAAFAAGNQGKFWEFRALLVSRYEEWAALSLAGFRTWLSELAADVGLESDLFLTDLESSETQSAVAAAYESAVALGISSIPTVFINGRLQQRPAMSSSGLNATIGLIVLAERQYRDCPPFVIDPAARYLAVLHTAKGDITIDLFADRAPLAVNSFIFLARNGWFDGTTFHRVVPGYLAQGGDPSGTGFGGPGYYFDNEIFFDLRFGKPGVVGMANAGPDTNGSQFFITFAPQPQLDGAYTVFGQVIDGMIVVENLTPRNPQTNPGQSAGDKILSVEIIEK